MEEGNIIPFTASIALAAVPVVIWLRLISKRTEGSGLYIKTFLFGTFSVVPPIILLIVFDKYPEYDIYAILESSIANAALLAIITNGVVGIIEEIGKNIIVRVIDSRHPEHVQTLNNALLLSVCAGLGFAFVENIFYFYNTWISPQYGTADLFSTFVFRSSFTVAAHMIFSGIFGYYFGLGKFAADITDLNRWQGKNMWFSKILGKFSGQMSFEVIREHFNLKGLVIAMGLHALYNASFDLEFKLPSVLIVVFGAIFITYLLNRKSGRLLFSVGKRRASTMNDSDEAVVLELLGMWINEGKFEEVVHTCDRLLKRDPDNNVVKLFREKARDNKDMQNFYRALKNVVKSNKEGTPIKVAPSGEHALAEKDAAVVLEALEVWNKQGNYEQVMKVAKRLLERNPDSEEAQILLQKAMSSSKLEHVFNSMTKLLGIEDEDYDATTGLRQLAS